MTRRVTSWDFRNSGFSGRGIQWTVLGEKNGLTLVERESRTTGLDGADYDWTGYGAWARDSVFFSRWQAGVAGPDVGSGQVWSYSQGRASIGNPVAITARWSGFMAGVDVGTAGTRGNQVSGQADILFDDRWGQAMVDVALTNIIDMQTLDVRADMEWNDLRVRNGAFRYGADSRSIQGRFYGPHHR